MKRPIGLTVISLLLFLLSFFAVMLILITVLSGSGVGYSTFASMIISTLFILGVGICLFVREKWSWFLSIAFFTFYIISAALNIFPKSTISDDEFVTGSMLHIISSIIFIQ